MRENPAAERSLRMSSDRANLSVLKSRKRQEVWRVREKVQVRKISSSFASHFGPMFWTSKEMRVWRGGGEGYGQFNFF